MIVARDRNADRAQIEAFIAERGVTLCPVAAVAETSAELPAADRAAIAARFAAEGAHWKTVKQREWERRKAAKSNAVIRSTRKA